MTRENQKEIYFHVGMGKTGSTYVQYKFFPKLKNVFYIQRTKYRKSVDIIAKTDATKYLVSNEFDRRLFVEVDWFTSRYPQTKIIIVLRRQDSWIASQYRRFVKNGFSGSIEEFIDLKNDRGEWKKEELFFYPKIEYIERKTKHKPLVLLYDELKENPFSFFDKIASYVGAEYDKNEVSLAPKHRSYSEKQLKFRRELNKVFSGQIKESQIRFFKVLQKIFFIYPIRYSALFVGALVPNALIPKGELIPKSYLHEIKEYYAEDWSKCEEYARASASAK